MTKKITRPPITSKKAIEFYDMAFKFLNPHVKRIPRFDFQDLPDSDRLSYELMTWDNFKNFLLLFEKDKSLFVDKNYRELAALETYAVNVLEYSRYSFKHGGCDWFLRLKTTHELLGVLHIYDLNWELWKGKHFPCMVGYAITENFRKQGLAYEATAHLLQQIPIIFKRFEATAEPKAINTASCKLLEKLGFIERHRFREDTSILYYKKLVKRIKKKTFDELWEEEKKYR